MRFRSGLAGVSIAALALAGCSGGGGPSPSPTSSPSPSPSPSPTAGLTDIFALDPAVLTIGEAAPVVLIKTGPTWLYLYNVATGQAQRIDVSQAGAPGYNLTIDGDVTWGGAEVAFDSAATDIIPGDSNGFVDVFLMQVDSGAVSRVSQSGAGAGNEGSFEPRISADGTSIVFTSFATNLVPGVATVPQAYRYSVLSGELSLVNPSGAAGSSYSSSPAISAGGRFIAYESSSQGEYSDDNFHGDVFVLDTKTGVTEQVSVATDGTSGDLLSSNPTISLNGRFVAFQSEASNLVEGDVNTVYDVFVRDRATGETRLISRAISGLPANGDSQTALMVQDGSGVVFGSQASDLVAGDGNNAYDVFYADLATGTLQRLSVGPGGEEADGDSYPDAVYGGRYLVFFTYATNLGGDGDDGPMRQYVYDLETGALTRFL